MALPPSDSDAASQPSDSPFSPTVADAGRPLATATAATAAAARLLTLSDWRAAALADLGVAGSLVARLGALAARLRQPPADPAWIHLATPPQVTEQAEALAARAAALPDRAAVLRELPLFGVPFAAKDNIDVAGWPTTAACPAFAHVAAASATAVTRLQAAGAVCVGKTNLDQFATGLVGTRSPYGRPASAFAADRVSGGSSSGSAVVVASGRLPFALGTDTAGSGRVPAGFNHIVGLKPTPGRAGTFGVVPACRSLDCVSVFALTVADAAQVLAVIEGADPADAYSDFVPGPAHWGSPAPRDDPASASAPGQPAGIAVVSPQGACGAAAASAAAALAGTSIVRPAAEPQAVAVPAHSPNAGSFGKPATGDPSLADASPAGSPPHAAVAHAAAARSVGDLPSAGRNASAGRTGEAVRRHPPLRIGVPAAPRFGDTAGYAVAWERAVAHLESLGHQAVPIDFAPLHAVAELLYGGPWVAERHASVRGLLARDPAAFDPTVRRVVEAAFAYSATDAFVGQYTLQAARQAQAALWRTPGGRAGGAGSGVDALMVPTAPAHPSFAEVDAEPLAANALLGHYTNFVNLLGWCALAVPFGFTPAEPAGAASAGGLPFGVTFIAPANHDAALARFGIAWQESLALSLGATGAAYRRDDLPIWPATAPTLPLVVVGAHLSGLPLNGQLVERGARFGGATVTAPHYRLYALPGSVPAKPGLLRVAADGAAIAVEVWDLPLAEVGSFLALIPPPLGLGSVELADGRWLHGFVCEAHALAAARDVTAFGGWRAFVRSLRAVDGPPTVVLPPNATAAVALATPVAVVPSAVVATAGAGGGCDSADADTGFDADTAATAAAQPVASAVGAGPLPPVPAPPAEPAGRPRSATRSSA